MLPSSLLFCAKLYVFNDIHIHLSECNCTFGFEQKYWQIDGSGEKNARIGGFAYPYSPPSWLYNLIHQPL